MTSPTTNLAGPQLPAEDLAELLHELAVAGGEITLTCEAQSEPPTWSVHVATDVGADGRPTCGGQSTAADLSQAYGVAIASLRLDQTAAGIR